MTVQFYLSHGREIIFESVARRTYRGVLLPGTEVLQSNARDLRITLQNFQRPLYAISHRIFEFFDKSDITTREKPGLRLEALMNGDLTISRNNSTVEFKAGHYHLTDVPLFSALFNQPSSCNIFVTHYSAELLEQLGIDIKPCDPIEMTGEMTTLIQEILRNPYEEKVRDFYYENCVRELLFFHLSRGKEMIPKEISDKDIAAVYQADAIIASNLNVHLTIEKLSRMTGTNEFKLKKGFRKIFGMGIFHRLLFRRMEQAKRLLETTDKSIGDVADLAGYDTAAGFIHAFRRECGVTPREWRIQRRKSDNDDDDDV